MNDRYLWTTLASTALCASLALLFGFGLVLHDMLTPAVAPPSHEEGLDSTIADKAPLEQAAEIRMLALGDSLTKGTGDSTGKGYALRLLDGMKLRYEKPVVLLNNLSVNGMQASQLSQRLESDSGFRYAVKRANLIVFSIGGNDLFLSARARLGNRELKAFSLDELTPDFDEAMAKFTLVVNLLNELNPSATVVYMGLYNPFYDIDELRDASLKMQVWNKEAYEAMHNYPQMLMVPTFDLFEERIGEYLSQDHFHPSGLGYERIASRMLESLK